MCINYFVRSRPLSLYLILFILVYFSLTLASKHVFSQDTKISQITLLVDNIQRSIEFYQRLGLSISYRKKSSISDDKDSFGYEKYPLTSDPKTEYYTIMSDGSKEGTNIALLAYEKPPLANARGNLMGLGVGDFILLIKTKDINFLYNRMDEFGARFYSRLQKSNTHNQLESETIYNFIVYDPDGHLVEVISVINN